MGKLKIKKIEMCLPNWRWWQVVILVFAAITAFRVDAGQALETILKILGQIL